MRCSYMYWKQGASNVTMPSVAYFPQLVYMRCNYTSVLHRITLRFISFQLHVRQHATQRRPRGAGLCHRHHGRHARHTEAGEKQSMCLHVVTCIAGASGTGRQPAADVGYVCERHQLHALRAVGKGDRLSCHSWHCSFGTSPSSLDTVVSGTSSTYSATDMCEGPSNVTAQVLCCCIVTPH